MRLTLRTLLAYLDDLLDPADAVELGKRIDENKFASELVNRIRTRMRLLRLNAPKVDGRGIGVDANTVAEYLDNTLPADLVPDLEKICLESDVHLAEVASCHQILAAVQDHPATFDAELKERVFSALMAHSDRTDAALIDESEEPADMPQLASASRLSAHPKPESTDGGAMSTTKGASGQGQRSASLVPLLATVAAMFLVALLGLRALGPFDRTHPVARWVGLGTGGASPTTVAQNGGNAGDANSDATGPDATGLPGKAIPRGDASPSEDNADAGSNSQPAAGASPDAENSLGTGGESPVAGAVEPGDGPGIPGGADAAAGRAPGNDRPQPGIGGEAGTGRPGDADAGAVGAELVLPGGEPRGPVRPSLRGPAPGDEGLGPNARPGADSRRRNLPPKPGDVAGNPPGSMSPPPEVGRFLSENHVLARRGPQDGLWYALPRGARLADGDHLVSLPIFRPQFVLTSGVQVMLVGEGAVGIQSIDANDLGGVELVVESGRLLVASSGKVDSVLPLNLGGLAGVVRFLDVDAELAIQVHRYLAPGSSPPDESPLTVTQLSARSGRIAWQAEGGEEEAIPSGHVRVQVAGQEPQIERAGYPSWADPKSVSKLDRDASEHLADQISPTKPLMLSLEEQLDFRRTEVRSLAARCLGQLGQYSALVRELSSEQQHSYWDEALDGLRAGLTRSAEDLAAIQAAANELGKNDGERAYRLIRDFSPDQLQQGGAAQLVENLDHPTLAIRVLAYENLRRITGSTQFYRPEAPADRRKTTVQSWRKRLTDGLIVHKSPPTPVPEREPLPKSEAEPARSPVP